MHKRMMLKLAVAAVILASGSSLAYAGATGTASDGSKYDPRCPQGSYITMISPVGGGACDQFVGLTDNIGGMVYHNLGGIGGMNTPADIASFDAVAFDGSCFDSQLSLLAKVQAVREALFDLSRKGKIVTRVFNRGTARNAVLVALVNKAKAKALTAHELVQLKALKAFNKSAAAAANVGEVGGFR
jgi:hypothetical protein